MRSIVGIMMVLLSGVLSAEACSVLYYIDQASGKIYAVNNEDYWYDVNPYIAILPAKKETLARLWYGWDNFAQGGINEAGLFFDAAVVPEQKAVEGYAPADYNLGDRLLASCRSVDEVLDYFEQHKLAYTDGHLLFGDKQGNAVVIEWVDGKQQLIPIIDNYLMMTNFILSASEEERTYCPRYEAMEQEIKRLKADGHPLEFLEVANIGAKAVQPAFNDEAGRQGGTLYSTFINITDMKFILVYKYDDTQITQLDLTEEFSVKKKRKIKIDNRRD